VRGERDIGRSRVEARRQREGRDRAERRDHRHHRDRGRGDHAARLAADHTEAHETRLGAERGAAAEVEHEVGHRRRIHDIGVGRRHRHGVAEGAGVVVGGLRALDRVRTTSDGAGRHELELGGVEHDREVGAAQTRARGTRVHTDDDLLHRSVDRHVRTERELSDLTEAVGVAVAVRVGVRRAADAGARIGLLAIDRAEVARRRDLAVGLVAGAGGVGG
ncbi:MAG: hypothetical protein ACK559_24685, partial [bacterium]